MRRAGALLWASLAFLGPAAAPASGANPSMSADFHAMMEWLSHEMAQGLAFNAGSTFDPPQEVKSRRFQPDISLGIGKMPLDKKKFPTLTVPALTDLPASKIFPSSVLFPNLAVHLRAGLPARMDMSLRFANATTPKGYKISPTTTGAAQSNSIGFGLRRHFFGEDGLPLLGLGANYNHVYGRFAYNTKFGVDSIQGFSADSDVSGAIAWNISSYGLNAVLSRTYGRWTPFGGVGYNYTTGSVRARLELNSETPLIAPVVGEASDHPEQSQARFILGVQTNRSWANFFSNLEIQAVGSGAGRAWVIHSGITLPFEIGARGFSSTRRAQRKQLEKQAGKQKAASAVQRGDYGEPVEKPEGKKKIKTKMPALNAPVPAPAQSQPDLIFIQ